MTNALGVIIGLILLVVKAGKVPSIIFQNIGEKKEKEKRNQ